VSEKGAQLKTDIQHAPLPKGPAGQFGFHLLQSHMLMKYSKNQEPAKKLVQWLQTTANYEKWFLSQKGFATPCTAAWEKHKLWEEDPVMAPYKVAARLGQAPGFAGPPNAKAAEVWTKYIITGGREQRKIGNGGPGNRYHVRRSSTATTPAAA